MKLEIGRATAEMKDELSGEQIGLELWVAVRIATRQKFADLPKLVD